MTRVSALMVTPAACNRPELLERALDRLVRQTHPVDELVVVAAEPTDGTHALERRLALVRGPEVRLVAGAIGASLGALRNQSVASATGDLLVQWDDDDLAHPERLARQIAALADAGAAYLSEVWQWFPQPRELFWTVHRRLPHACHPGTGLFAQRPRYPEHGDASQRGEDTAACLDLWSRGRVALVENAPELFVYVSHGSNTWNLDHHRMLARELGLSRGLLRRRADAVAASLARIDIGAEPVTVMGSNGPAFVWHPSTGALDAVA